jgi:hypothetical protein
MRVRSRRRVSEGGRKSLKPLSTRGSICMALFLYHKAAVRKAAADADDGLKISYVIAMTVAERQRAEAEKYRAMVPEIADSILHNREPVKAAGELAEKYELDTTLVYKWFQLTEADLESRRKRAAVVALIPVWIFAAMAAAIVIAAMTGAFSWGTSRVVPLVSASLVLAGASAFRLRGLTRRVYRRRIAELREPSE